jgi:hypothetical protein
MVPIEQEAGSDPQREGKLWKRGKTLFPAGNQIAVPKLPAISVIIIPTNLKVIFEVTSDK